MINYFFVLGAFLVAACMSRVIIPRIIFIAQKKKLFDEEDARKVHRGIVPRLAGFSFIPILLFSLAFTVLVSHVVGHKLIQDIYYGEMQFYSFACGLILLYLIGLKDDLIGSRYRVKFVVQLIAASFIIMSGLWINNLHGLFGIYALPIWFGAPLTLLLIIFIINAINLIDGIDGLASGLSSISLVTMGAFFIMGQSWLFAILAFVMLGTLIPFFYYNVFGKIERNTKIFMGDTGSLTLGYVLAFLVIRIAVRSDDICFARENIIGAFSTLLVPIFDACRVVWVRFRNKKNPFLPDQNHIHHKFLKIGLTPRWAMISIFCISFIFCVMNMSLSTILNINLLFFLNIILWIGLNYLFNRLISKEKA